MMLTRLRWTSRKLNYFQSTAFKSTEAGVPQICIIGGGPAGFYAAQQLVKLIPDSKVDIYERLPVPFGLVRFGVAPDHPEVKNVINTFTKTAYHTNVSFIGNVTLGRDVSLKDLQNNYHAVLLTYGADEDHKLNIPGEDLKNVVSARDFVGWYNGLPTCTNFNINLDCEEVVVLGQGNVAVDVARILLTSVDELKKTDITQYSLEALSKSKVKKVSVIGRRGPLQVAFTIKELREMINLPNVETKLDKNDFVGIEEIIPNLDRPRKRLTELLYKTATSTSTKVGADRIFEIIFKRSPLEFKGTESLNGILVGVNKLEGTELAKQKAVKTDVTHEIPCGLAFRSIGYKSIQADTDIPFDSKLGVAKNCNGRINDGLYCSGWLSTGPLGVILSTMSNAFATAKLMHKDITEGKLNVQDSKPGSSEVLKGLSQKGVQTVSFGDWEKIDKEEERLGAAIGKPREKIVSVVKMLEVAAS